jgi:hypothetical protein
VPRPKTITSSSGSAAADDDPNCSSAFCAAAADGNPATNTDTVQVNRLATHCARHAIYLYSQNLRQSRIVRVIAASCQVNNGF